MHFVNPKTVAHRKSHVLLCEVSAIGYLVRVAILDPKHCGFQLVNYQVHGLIEPHPSSSPLHPSMGFWAFISDIDIASSPPDAIEKAFGLPGRRLGLLVSRTMAILADRPRALLVANSSKSRLCISTSFSTAMLRAFGMTVTEVICTCR